MNRTTIIIAGLVAAGALIVLSSRCRRHSHDVAGDLKHPLRDLEHDSRRRGRGRRNSPRSDGHATPAGGHGRPGTAPSYFTA
ncbi:MAG: hypothetical protein L0K47_09445 [Acidipropionibacterium jensenii]|uniref:hypothetical protein n=1 Tax=Acidipropionibacterium jensenii TaxID=1749 RepID=UPI0026486598|nr:hypothetical protein [Acidipropionibacterium jensenii]MDN6513514.1 hypothetical protein [Acidipropionibacterium jensenii]